MSFFSYLWEYFGTSRFTLHLFLVVLIVSSLKYLKIPAILPVHLFGLSCDMNHIMKLARERSLFMIEDMAQAFGAEYRHKKIGFF